MHGSSTHKNCLDVALQAAHGGRLTPIYVQQLSVIEANLFTLAATGLVINQANYVYEVTNAACSHDSVISFNDVVIMLG